MQQDKHSSKSNLKTGLQRGESWAFEELYHLAFPAVAILIKNNSGTMDDAKDLFQEGLITVVQYCRKPDFRFSASPKTFLYSIVKNQWLKKLRKKKQLPEDYILDESDTGIQLTEMDNELIHFEFEGFSESDRIQRLAKTKFAQLSEICKDIIIMKVVYNFSHKEIIKETGDTYEYAKQRLFNCLNQLRKAIKKEL